MSNLNRKRKPTETSSFGSSGRISHDSSKFYNSRLYEGINNKDDKEFIENEILQNIVNQLYCKSSENMEELPDASVHLMITSPPYNVQKQYDSDMNLEEYLNFLKRVWRDVYRVMIPGGRACINIANLGRKPYIPLHAYIIEQMQDIGFLMRGEIIWNKGSSASSSTAWGSWRSAGNPVIRDVHEYILVFSKGNFGRKRQGKESTIQKEDFLDWTKSIWTFPAVSAKRIGHPAPFPIELPHRLIQLYSYKGDVVLDPFVGSGTTCLASVMDGRNFLGYDTNQAYLQIAQKRIIDFQIKR